MNLLGVTVSRFRKRIGYLVLMLTWWGPAYGGDRVVRVADKPAGNVWHVRQLPVSGYWHDGWVEFRRFTPLDRGFRFRHGYHAIYTAYVLPGAEYALGLRYPASEKDRVHVMLFDRWPFDAKAKRYDLPMGPVVRTNRHAIEYRWRLGISPRSPGGRLFVVVEAEPPAGQEAMRFRHSIYVVDSPRHARDLFGKGISYLRGPSDLYLAETVTEQPIILVEPTGYGPLGSEDGAWRPDLNFVRNGDFHLGLEGWELVSEQGREMAMRHVAVGDDGLRLWNDGKLLDYGVRQSLLRHVGGGGSLRLAVKLRIDREVASSPGDAAFPVSISICYVDNDDDEHCGAEAYRRRFTTVADKNRHGGVVRVRKGEWREFEFDLLAVSPTPAVIQSITVEGGIGEAWVQNVALVRQR